MRTLKNIIYVCPSVSKHTGGVRVICRHSSLIDGLRPGRVASALLLSEAGEFRPPWFEYSSRIMAGDAIDTSGDLIVLPELLASRYWQAFRAHGIRYGIFVQNGYYVLDGVGANADRLRAHVEMYRQATLILSISDEVSATLRRMFPECAERLIELRCSVSPETFHTDAASQRNSIAFMPRKLGRHARMVVERLMLSGLDGWSFAEIDGMSEAEVAATLRTTRIFMSFSNFEGLGLPPIEAAMSGNRVIGYTGGGGREYWRAPLFEEVAQADVDGFAATVSAAMRRLSGEAPAATLAAAAPAIAALADRYSPAREQASVLAFVSRAAELFAG